MKKTKKAQIGTQLDDSYIQKEVIKILAQVARVNILDITDSSSIREDLGIDSLNAMEILAAIEIKFKITVEEIKAFNIVTVMDLIEIIKGYLRKKNKK